MTTKLDSQVAHLPSSEIAERKRIHLRRLEIFTDHPFKHHGSDLRRAITAAFPDNDRIHNHLDSGQYRLPPIRFCVTNGRPNIVAINEGIGLLHDLYRELELFRVHQKTYRVAGSELFDSFEPIALTKEQYLYRTLRPWFALNGANHEKYENADSEHARERVLKSVLIGNLLSLSKSVGYFVPGKIEATIIRSKRSKLVHKGVKMMGFRVLFSTNMLLPPWLGIGKLVSKGYGLVQQVS